MIEIKTKDVTEAAYLWCVEDFKFNRLERSQKNKRTVFFIFQTELTEEDAGKVRNSFYNEETLVEPKKFQQRLSDVRNLLYATFGKQ